MDRGVLNRKLHALLKDCNLLAHKHDMLSGYNVKSTKDLTINQLLHFIGRMEEIAKEKAVVKVDPLKAKRSQVLNLLSNMGITAMNGDWKSVNSYLLDKRVLGKHLYEAKADELDTLIVRLQIIKRKASKQEEVAKWN